MPKIKLKYADKSKKKYIIIFGVFIVVCLFFILACFQFYRSLQTTIRDENKGYLQEVARKIGSNIERIISDNYAMLYNMASAVEAMNEAPMSEVQSLLQKQQKRWNYTNIMLVDESGRTYDLNNKEVSLNFDDTIRNDILNGRESMATAQIINNQEFIVFSVPMDLVMENGKRMVALAASYSPLEFVHVLSMDSFNEQAYSQIITKSGTAVTRPSSEYEMKTGYNIFNSLESAKIENELTLEQIKQEIAENKTDQIRFSFEGIDRYMVYSPISQGQWYLLTFVPAKAVNEKSDMMLNTMLVLCGLVAVAFTGLCVILFYIFNSNKRRLEKLAFVDEVTCGNTIQRFYEIAREILDSNPEKSYAFVYTNIENFKVLNEQLGRQTCDLILKLFYEFASTEFKGCKCTGRLFADNFCLLVEFDDENELSDRFKDIQAGAEVYMHKNHSSWGTPTVEFGVYIIENKELSFAQMTDRAKLALREAKWVLGSKVAYYNDSVRQRLFREKQLEDRMESALANHEFQMYLQPKYKLPEKHVGGAEALVRWISAEEGMIFPDEFIPLFERNGFIVNLDLWMFEEACRAQQSWRKRGLPVVKISVNCSRIHFRNPDFLKPYILIAEEYDIGTGEIEIELTESVVFENTERLIEIINSIHAAGFGCSMDDFGSGYSSLNLIQNIPVDTLKLDKIFFRANSVEHSRTEAVVSNIISLAKSLTMATVAEGVEDPAQVEMLIRANCDYVQGYVFAKPMNLSSFEKLAYGENKECREY